MKDQELIELIQDIEEAEQEFGAAVGPFQKAAIAEKALVKVGKVVIELAKRELNING